MLKETKQKKNQELNLLSPPQRPAFAHSIFIFSYKRQLNRNEDVGVSLDVIYCYTKIGLSHKMCLRSMSALQNYTFVQTRVLRLKAH